MEVFIFIDFNNVVKYNNYLNSFSINKFTFANSESKSFSAHVKIRSDMSSFTSDVHVFNT